VGRVGEIVSLYLTYQRFIRLGDGRGRDLPFLELGPRPERRREKEFSGMASAASPLAPILVISEVFKEIQRGDYDLVVTGSAGRQHLRDIHMGNMAGSSIALGADPSRSRGDQQLGWAAAETFLRHHRGWFFKVRIGSGRNAVWAQYRRRAPTEQSQRTAELSNDNTVAEV
jgi:hypothetical protein